ncbi:MAG: Gfo/Idh/MocA family oxidoreductase, partial [Gemmatimonadetes bacterium]|nr:Gfo/Idh/MocA family oxidoreductase [Gemmatimonadota bacterium]
MTDPAPIRIALAGCGRISRNHFEAIDKVNGLELVAVCDIIPERAREAGERHAVPSFESFDEMLSSVQCDAVALCTPSGLHPKHGIIAARAGKHVICEKPMAISLEDA